jgi:transposase-like protein
MNCPYCDRTEHSFEANRKRLIKNGVNRSGSQRYYCANCQKSFTDSSLKPGRPTVLDRALTTAERKKRSRAKIRDRALSIALSRVN